jgi:hypothetical protein
MILVVYNVSLQHKSYYIKEERTLERMILLYKTNNENNEALHFEINFLVSKQTEEGNLCPHCPTQIRGKRNVLEPVQCAG